MHARAEEHECPCFGNVLEHTRSRRTHESVVSEVLCISDWPSADAPPGPIRLLPRLRARKCAFAA